MRAPLNRILSKLQSPAHAFTLAGLAVIGLPVVGYLALPVQAQIAVRNQGYIPYSDAPINYRTAALNDPVAELQKQLDAGNASLAEKAPMNAASADSTHHAELTAPQADKKS